MDLIPNDWKNDLKLELFKRKIPLKALYPYKRTRKVEAFQKSLMKKFTSTFKLIVLIQKSFQTQFMAKQRTP